MHDISVTERVSSVMWVYSVVGVLKSGSVIRLHVISSTEEAAAGKIRLGPFAIKFHIDIVAESIRPSSLSTLPFEDEEEVEEEVNGVRRRKARQLWFLGSRLSDSLLLRVEMDRKVDLSPLSVRNNQVVHLITDGAATSAADEEQRLYGNAFVDGTLERTSQDTAVEWQPDKIVIHTDDVLVNVGPITDGLFSAVSDELLNFIDNVDWDRTRGNLSDFYNELLPRVLEKGTRENQWKDSLLLCAGAHEQSSLMRIYSGWSFLNVSSHSFVDATSVLSVVAGDVGSSSAFAVLFVVLEHSTRVLHCLETYNDSGGCFKSLILLRTNPSCGGQE